MRLECTHAHHHVVPVHLVAVKIRTVYAYELCLVADCNTAAAAHACAVDHDRVKRHDSVDVVRLGCLACELHHDGRSDGGYFRRGRLRFAFFFKRNGDESLCSSASVVGHDDYFICDFLHFFNEDEQVFIASTDDHCHMIAGSLESFNNRIARSNTDTASHDNYRAVKLL